MEEQSLGQHATAIQRSKLAEKKNVLHRKLISWQEVQQIYIPAIVTIQRPRFLGQTFDTPDIYSMAPLLPSNLGQTVPWDKRLGEYEWQLRLAQARDALNGLRQNLRVRDFLTKKKKDWARGVRQNTRSQTVISQTQNKVTACATRYRIARNALSRLATSLEKGTTWNLEFRLLNDGDIQGLPAEGWGEGRRMLSWIWTTQDVSDNVDNEPQLNDGNIDYFTFQIISYPLLIYSTASSMVSRTSTRFAVVRRD